MIAHLAACTVSAVVAVAAVLALRGQRAAWRHAILFLALARFSVPTEWLSGLGAKLVRVAPAAPQIQRAAGDLREFLTGPGFESRPTPASPRPGGFPYRGIWIAGVVVCAGLWARRAWRPIPVVRAASAYEQEVFVRATSGVKAELRIVAADLVPGAAGMWRSCILLPDGLSVQLCEMELEAVLAHEAAHVRRRDNLTAAVSRAVVSAFWFHPLVWWIERRMLAEREAACDEMVLARGTRAEDYAVGILKVCRMAFAGRMHMRERRVRIWKTEWSTS